EAEVGVEQAPTSARSLEADGRAVLLSEGVERPLDGGQRGLADLVDELFFGEAVGVAAQVFDDGWHDGQARLAAAAVRSTHEPSLRDRNRHQEREFVVGTSACGVGSISRASDVSNRRKRFSYAMGDI